MITSIHQSTLGMLLRCGEQFRRRYIENEVIPPGVAAGRGTGVHRANETNLKQKVKTGEDMPLSDLKDAARDGFVSAFRNGVYLPKEDLPAKKRLLNEGLNDCLRCTAVYREEVAPIIKPIAVEETFKISIKGIEYDLEGRIDYQEEPLVGDLKTTTRAWPKQRIKEEIQVPFYSYVFEQERGQRPTFRYDVLIARRNKEGVPTSADYQPLTHICSNRDYRGLLAKLLLFEKIMKSGVFPPTNPTNWICSRQYCGYWNTCIYVGNAPPKRQI
jgi:hypothetical protein